MSARTSSPSPLTSYELPLLSPSALCRTCLEDTRIVLGSALAVLVRFPNLRFDSDMADLVSPLNDDRYKDYLTRYLLTRSNFLLPSVHGELNPGLNLCHIQYLRLQGQYHLIIPPNGLQDPFLGHILFYHMGPTLKILPNAPYLQVPVKAQDRNIPPVAFIYLLLEVRLYNWGGGEKDQNKRREKWGSEARNGSKVKQRDFCSSSSDLSNPDREIIK